MTFLGLDLSLTGTGLAHIGPDGSLLYARTIETKPSQPIGHRLVMIADTIVAFVQEHQPDGILAEAPTASKFGTVAMCKVHGAVTYAFTKAGIALPLYACASTLKKFATGKGSGDKSNVKMMILAKWGLQFTDDDQADAYVLARIAGVLKGVIPAGPAYEVESIKAVLKYNKMSQGEE